MSFDNSNAARNKATSAGFGHLFIEIDELRKLLGRALPYINSLRESAENDMSISSDVTWENTTALCKDMQKKLQ